jgi:hypothetical protein
MTKTSKARKASPTPATGIATWVADAKNGNRVLRIETETGVGLYEVEPLRAGWFRLHGLKLKTGEFACYAVKPGTGCTCPDATYSRGPTGCKHYRGFVSALGKRPY